MEIQYTANGGPNRDECWKTWSDGKEVLYKRVAAGIALPKPEQPQGCAIVVGELYRAAAPPTFTALGAKVALWLDLEQGLGELRQQFKVGILVTEPEEEAREVLYRVSGLKWASGDIPLSILPAPKNALGNIAGDVARQRVDGLIREGRLHHMESVRAVLDQAAEQAAVALQCVMIWLLENRAYYEGPRGPREYKRILGGKV